MNIESMLICIVLPIVGLVGIWNNWIGHNPNMSYSSVAPFWKFYGYPIWNVVAFFSFGLLKYKSWKNEHNEMLRKEGLDCYVWGK